MRLNGSSEYFIQKNLPWDKIPHLRAVPRRPHLDLVRSLIRSLQGRRRRRDQSISRVHNHPGLENADLRGLAELVEKCRLP